MSYFGNINESELEAATKLYIPEETTFEIALRFCLYIVALIQLVFLIYFFYNLKNLPKAEENSNNSNNSGVNEKSKSVKLNDKKKRH